MAETKNLEDGISKLPEPIIHHVLSFLKTKEAARTSLLSKAWLKAWKTRPTLNISSGIFTNPKTGKRYKTFDKYVIRILQRYSEQKIGLQNLKLNLESGFASDSLIKLCIQVAVENGVKKLFFCIPGYTLPLMVLESKSLVDLTVKECVLEPQNVSCFRLRRLCLSEVSLDEVMFDKIMLRCQFLEDLEVSNCNGIKSFMVTKHRNLKKFVFNIRENQSIEVEAPNLELFICRNEDVFWNPDWKPCRLDLQTSQYQNLKCLLLCGIDITHMFFRNLTNIFPNLEDLSIQYCQNLEKIILSSPSVKKFHLLKNKKLKEGQLDFPRIVHFEYVSDGGIIPRLSFTATSGRWLSNICVWCRKNVDNSWFMTLKEFLVKLNQSEISFKLYFGKGVAFNVDEMKNSEILCEPPEIQELYVGWVQSREEFSLSSAFPILNGVFWTCHPKTIRHHGSGPLHQDPLLMLLHEMLVLRYDDHHSNFLEIESLQHYLLRIWQVLPIKSDDDTLFSIHTFNFGNRTVEVYGRHDAITKFLINNFFDALTKMHNSFI